MPGLARQSPHLRRVPFRPRSDKIAARFGISGIRQAVWPVRESVSGSERAEVVVVGMVLHHEDDDVLDLRERVFADGPGWIRRKVRRRRALLEPGANRALLLDPRSGLAPEHRIPLRSSTRSPRRGSRISTSSALIGSCLLLEACAAPNPWSNAHVGGSRMALMGRPCAARILGAPSGCPREESNLRTRFRRCYVKNAGDLASSASSNSAR